MKKVILVPDSFKGTMTSTEICEIMSEAICKHYPDAQVISIPVADGGEGSVDCFLAAVGGKKIFVPTKGPYFDDMESYYGLLPDGTAIIEMASCAGLPLVEDRKSAGNTTTFGVGLLIAHAAKNGCRKIIVGLGGSATNDGGTGLASALGVTFKNRDGNGFIPVGATLNQIDSIDVRGLMPEMHGVELVAMCDIDNPLFGTTGAAHVFGPQKGADAEMVDFLDAGLRHLAKVASHDLGQDAAELPGAGAAGGMGFGMVAFLGAQLQMGIETVLDSTGFDQQLQGADMVFSGEGKIDAQSLRGKVVIGVARRTKNAGVPLVAIVGDIGDGMDAAYEAGVTGIFSINRVAVPYRETRLRSREDLRLTMDNLLRYTNAFNTYTSIFL